jgi:DNA mismatch repair protein MutL
LGQVGGLYVILETQDGLVLMDPHAAHERVLFDRYMAQIEKGAVPAQGLLMPETVSLAARDAARIRKHLDVFKTMGFGISEFGADTFVVDALPACIADVGVGGLLMDITQALEEAGNRGDRRWREEAIAQSACKTAVKARDTLRLDEIQQLVIDLAKTEMPYTCPHGRPTLILMPFGELNRKFGRE